jgi:hypothetical protein
MPRPHSMDPLIDDFAPLAEKFGRSTAERGGDHAEAHQTAVGVAKLAGTEWARAVAKPPRLGALMFIGAGVVVALIVAFTLGEQTVLPSIVCAVVLVIAAVALSWRWLGGRVIASTSAGRNLMGFARLERRALDAYTDRRRELGEQGCDCPA